MASVSKQTEKALKNAHWSKCANIRTIEQDVRVLKNEADNGEKRFKFLLEKYMDKEKTLTLAKNELAEIENDMKILGIESD